MDKARHKAIVMTPPAFTRPRGANILILDTSGVIPLALPIPSDFFDPQSGIPEAERPRSYLDLLKKLPSQVVSEIHIPNSVVQELIGYSCYRDADGKFIAVETVPEYRMYASHEHAVRFLQPALSGTAQGHPKIVIDCSPTGSDYVKKYLSLPAAGPEREAAIDHLRKGEGNHIGEWDCVQLAYDHVGKYQATANLVVDDNEAFGMVSTHARHHRKCFGKLPRIASLNSRALLYTLEKSGMLWQAGLRDDVTEPMISQRLVDDQNAVAKTLGNERVYYLPYRRAEGMDFNRAVEDAVSGRSNQGRY